MRKELEQGVQDVQTLATKHADELWNILTTADPQTPYESQMIMGAYMGALTTHLQETHPEGAA